MSMIELAIDNQPIAIQIKRQAYRRSIKLQYRAHDFVVTAPITLSISEIKEFVESQKKWMSKRLQDQKNKFILPELPFSDDTKRAAKILVLNLIEQYKHLYPYQYQRITIKDLQSKWGSCSVKRNLNFNYRIIALPEHLAAYLVVHELCHLAELNHSVHFWNLVAKAFPEHQKLRKALHKVDFDKIQ